MKRVSMVAAAVLFTATGAFAQQAGGVKITGTVDNEVFARGNENNAIGQNSEAHQSIGTIHNGTEISGTLNNEVVAEDNANYATGQNSVACQTIGSIGESESCD